MPVTNLKDWETWVNANTDNYGKCCVDVARRVMEILDEDKTFDANKIICQADKEIKAGGITGFMAGVVASMVSQCHSRGNEFRKAWNLDCQLSNEGEKANETKGMCLNPALLGIILK